MTAMAPTLGIKAYLFKHSARVRQAKFQFYIRLSFRGDFKIAVTAAILDIVDYSNRESQFMHQCLHKSIKKIASEYDQEIPQSQTADNPVTPRGRAAQPSRDTRKTN